MGDSEDKKHLKDYVHRRLNKMYDEMLYSIEPAVKNSYTYSVLRSRVLRAGNNALRDIHAYINQTEVTGRGDTATYEIFQVEDQRSDK
jgi:hypothetical protein